MPGRASPDLRPLAKTLRLEILVGKKSEPVPRYLKYLITGVSS
jgi:hypothetical protein